MSLVVNLESGKENVRQIKFIQVVIIHAASQSVSQSVSQSERFPAVQSSQIERLNYRTEFLSSFSNVYTNY